MFTRHHLLTLTTLLLLLALTAPSLAAPSQPWYEKYSQRRVTVPQSYYEGLSLRRQTPLNPNAVRDVVCLDTSTKFLLYDEYAASLAICNGIAGAGATRCAEGTGAETAGRSGKALFTLRALDKEGGATINVSKDAWVRCVAAAREACPEGSFSGVCVGGATAGDLGFALTSV